MSMRPFSCIISHSTFLHFKDPLQLWFLDQRGNFLINPLPCTLSSHEDVFLMHWSHAPGICFISIFRMWVLQDMSAIQPKIQTCSDFKGYLLWVNVSLLNQHIFAYLTPNTYYTSVFKIISPAKKITTLQILIPNYRKNSGEVTERLL